MYLFEFADTSGAEEWALLGGRYSDRKQSVDSSTTVWAGFDDTLWLLVDQEVVLQ